ncbi:MAG: hypothetical protein IPM51_15435 [Sphingobacteriaceae bacterium]|nr:hypothetical protein [Sphingobacteriaceae bacterium]
MSKRRVASLRPLQKTGTVVTKNFGMKMSQKEALITEFLQSIYFKDVRVFPNPASGTLQWFKNSMGMYN